MTKAEKATEPNMDDILASIRRIIAEDPSGAPRDSGTVPTFQAPPLARPAPAAPTPAAQEPKLTPHSPQPSRLADALKSVMSPTADAGPLGGIDIVDELVGARPKGAMPPPAAPSPSVPSPLSKAQGVAPSPQPRAGAALSAPHKSPPLSPRQPEASASVVDQFDRLKSALEAAQQAAVASDGDRKPSPTERKGAAPGRTEQAIPTAAAAPPGLGANLDDLAVLIDSMERSSAPNVGTGEGVKPPASAGSGATAMKSPATPAPPPAAASGPSSGTAPTRTDAPKRADASIDLSMVNSALGALDAGLRSNQPAPGPVPFAAAPPTKKSDTASGVASPPSAQATPARPIAAQQPISQPAAKVEARGLESPASVPAPVVAASPTPSTPPAARTLEDAVAEMLRPMLRQWLDANLPRIVEKALEVELQKLNGIKSGDKLPG